LQHNNPNKLQFYNQKLINIKIMLQNKVQLIGNLGANPEVKTLESGKKVARFSLATTESYKNEKGEKVKETQWHTLIAWNKLAELVETYLTKGNEIAVEGKLVNKSWTDKNGTKKYATEILMKEMLMLKTK